LKIAFSRYHKHEALESRDWLAGSLDEGVFGLIRIRADRQYLSTNYDIKGRVLEWWEKPKTMVVLSQFIQRINLEDYDGRDLLVNTAIRTLAVFA